MDHNRSSSSLSSNDNTGRNSGANRASTHPHHRSSLSNASSQHARSISSQASPVSSSRRTHTPTPSYMNYQNGAAARAATQSPSTPRPAAAPDATPSKSSASATFGLLLLAFAAEPHPSTVRTVERLLQARSYASIAILANIEQENTVKELKINLYSLIGSMGLEMAVNVYLRDGWTEVHAASAVQAATNNAGSLRAVLCSPVYDPIISPAETDILALPSTSIEGSWTTSFSFLHSLAKACFPKLSASASNSSNASSSPHSPTKSLPDHPGKAQFAVLNPRTDSPTAQISKAACDALLAQLSQSHAGGVVVGSIEQLLPPERKPLATKPLKENGAAPSIFGGVSELDPLIVDGERQPGQQYAMRREDDEQGSSPTELYSMWALQEQYDGQTIE